MANVIIMASGLGTRMRPLTNTTPKPLIKVKGTPMVETVIDALNAIKIDNIFVVVGYLGDQFGYLTEKYNNVSIVRNTQYETVNNISSIYAAKEVLDKGDCYICEADLFISDKNLFLDKPDKTVYYGKMVEGYSDDWVFELGEDGYINRVGKVGTDCYNMVGVSYFTSKDAHILKTAIEDAYSRPGYEDMFWDDVVNNNLDKLKMMIHPVKEGQITEIDTVEELEKINEG